jgi:hypothetical protein
LALLASFAALGLLAVPASAAKLRIHESVRSKSTSAQFDSVTATCPKGEGAISGGYTVPEFSANTGLFFASGSFLGDGGWQASVSQIGDDLEDGFVTSFAYCAKLGKDVVTRGDTTDISNGTFTDLTASCKRKESIISGGWALSTGPDTSALVTRSLKQGKRSWKITGGTTVGTGTLIAIADCVPKKGAPDLVTRKGQGPVSGATSTVTASCRKNAQFVSASFSSNTVFMPCDFHHAWNRTWGTKGATFGDPGTATVAAYCEKLKKKRKGRR